MLRIPAGQCLWVTSAEKHPADPGHPLHGADRNGSGPAPTAAAQGRFMPNRAATPLASRQWHEIGKGMERPPGVPASFDVRTIVYLRRGTNPPDLAEKASTALHHAHLAHLAELGRRGIIAANGPLLDQSDETLRGMSVYTVDATEARRLAEQDPAVRAGRFRVDVARWAVAAGRIAFPEQDGPVGHRVRFEDL
jgi:hypothetical protein